MPPRLSSRTALERQWALARQQAAKAFDREQVAYEQRIVRELRYLEPDQLKYIQYDMAVNEDIAQRPWAYDPYYLFMKGEG